MNIRGLLNLITSLFLTITVARAQGGTKGSVSGKLVDATTGAPLEFATVALIKKADNQPYKAIQTDLQGNFKLDNLADGLYLLRASYVGYANFVQDNLTIGIQKRVYQIGTLKLNPSKAVLKEVAVRAQRSQIQLGVDRKVFAVDQSLVSQGGSATDLLGNVSSIQVDVDGNLNLRGSGNVRVLINGKPSALAGASMADILQSIPASSIENIEVITNPSSKYDAEGQTGIINIVLKKNARFGTNGNLSLSAGNQQTYNASGSVAWQNKKVNLYANYNYRTAHRSGNGFTDKTTFAQDGPITQNQIANQNFNFAGHNVRAGIDLNLDEKTTLSFSGNGNFRGRTRYQFGNTNTYTQGKLTQLTSQNNKAVSSGNRNLDFNVDFDHKYKRQGEELTANFGYSTDNERNTDVLNTAYNFYTPTAFRQRIQNNYGLQKEHQINAQIDYTLPINKVSKLEAGLRSTFSQNDNGNNVDTLQGSVYVYDATLTNHLLYKEQVHAGYVNYQRTFGNFGVQVGARLEEALIDTRVRETGEQHHQDYFRVYPSIFLSDKLNDNETIQLSYTRRVSRPRDRQINVFLDKSDPFNWQQGNPNLKPEDTHSFELSYINYWKSVTLTSSVYYRLTNDNIEQFRTQIDSATTLMSFANITQTQNGGFELIGKVTATQAIDITANLNIYHRYLQGVPALGLPSNSGFAWNGNLTANLKPMKKLGIQLRGDYQAPQPINQGRQRAMAGLDAGLRYDITRTVSLSANVRDAFNSRKFGSIIDYNTGAFPYHSESTRRFGTRAILFTASYRFGSAPDQQKKNRKKGENGDDNNGGGNPDEGGPKI